MNSKILLLSSLLSLIAGLIPASGANTVNYDTAWAFVYDGGKLVDGKAIDDYFYDVKELSDGSCLCLGETRDSLNMNHTLLIRLDANGKMIMKKYFKAPGCGRSLCIAKNGDYLIGGGVVPVPELIRTDKDFNVKWVIFYRDTIKQKPYLSKSAIINCVKETKRGSIICAVGDPYPAYGSTPNNYAAYLEFDSTGKLHNWNEWYNSTSYDLGGSYIEEAATGCYLLSGNKGVVNIDSGSLPVWTQDYSFYLTGVGTEVNEVARAKMLRDSSLFVIGRAYEKDCWTSYSKLIYDAWWSPISYSSGANASWNLGGEKGKDDYLYDFTQLKNGNLVFAGLKGMQDMFWLFVTDSTGGKSLWEKSYNLPNLIDPGDNIFATAICATSDGGFTVVGRSNPGTVLGGNNALAAHFVPKPVSVESRAIASSPQAPVALRSAGGQHIRFSFTLQHSSSVTLTVYQTNGSIAGVVPAGNLGSGKNAFNWDFSRLCAGLYSYCLDLGERKVRGTVALHQ